MYLFIKVKTIDIRLYIYIYIVNHTNIVIDFINDLLILHTHNQLLRKEL